MNMNKENRNLKIQNNIVSILNVNNEDYISLTDIARYKNPDLPGDVIIKWMSNKSSFDYYSLWEELFNSNFKLVEYREFKNDSSTQSFTMSPSRWIEKNAIGFITKRGKYNGGTYAHPDIALEFASWIDPAFKLYLIKEFERLKYKEKEENKTEWSIRRMLAKTNYKIQVNSINENIVPKLTEKQKKYIYSDEADVINVALFGMTASEWRKKNNKLDGNIRDGTDILHLIILSNLEVLNANMIEENISQRERIERLNNTARKELNILANDKNIVGIEKIDKKRITR